MRGRGRVRPSKPMSALGLIVGIVFVCIGVFVAIPGAGAFGVFWTLIALAITGYHAVNLFSERGVAHEVVEFDTSPSARSEPSVPPTTSPEQRLTLLEELKRKGLPNDEEYEEQRKRILDDL